MEMGKNSALIMTLIGLLIFALAALLIVDAKTDLSFALFGNQKIKGRVLSREKAPLQGAFVAVQSGNFDGPGSPGPIIVQTDETGLFKAEIRSRDYVITAWKEGYAENGCNDEEYCSEKSEIFIELRKIGIKTSLPTKDGFYDFSDKNGFSFSLERAVNATDPEADIIFELDKINPLQLVIRASDTGGIAHEPFSRNVDFDNSPVAPEKYERHFNIALHPNSILFLKTHAGKYAKFREMASINEHSDGRKSLDLKSVRIIWAYQTDGSRNLETASALKSPAIFEHIP